MSNEGDTGGRVRAVVWRKSSHTREGNCVELADIESVIGVRDSKNPEGPALRFKINELASFLERIKSGNLDH